MRSFPGASRLAGVILVLMGFSGCLRQRVAVEIVRAPNHRPPRADLRLTNFAAFRDRADRMYAAAWTVPVGPPAAALSVAVVNPGDYRLKHSVGPLKLTDGRVAFGPTTEWAYPPRALRGGGAPLATVFVLPGYTDSKESLLFWALFLAQHHYRAILVDLRGQGRSTGDWITYGAVEHQDLGQVLDDAARRGWIAGPVAALGVSYGASIALQWAGHDGRVKTVVALEPFSDPRRAVIDFARAVEPQVARYFSDAAFGAAEDRAAQLAHFSWADASVLGSVARTAAPIFYVYAVHDHWVPPENTLKLAARTKSPHAVMSVHFTNTGTIDDHLMLSWMLEVGVGPEVIQWLGATVGGGKLGDFGQRN
ncbi:MAG TPA: alpha/beta fold hydrolase [Opitutaceae bacterium]|jgi:pimeloyl-ACP methyl ester carboxylesterase|nr:alpha/beta fold hydrolase [Opitutaceae bacterium]